MMKDEPTQIAQHIEPNPHCPGSAEARVKGYGVAVWALVSYLEAVHGDAARVAADDDLPREVVDAALAYYRLHRAEIDAGRALSVA